MLPAGRCLGECARAFLTLTQRAFLTICLLLLT